MDVRFKNPTSFSRPANYKAAFESLKDELVKMRAPESVDETASVPQPPTPHNSSLGMKIKVILPKFLELFCAKVLSFLKLFVGVWGHVLQPEGSVASTSSVPKNQGRAEVIVLLNTYNNCKAESSILVDEKSLMQSIKSNYLIKYWAQYHHFPELQKLARKLLFVPSSSASSERTCSAAAYVISKKRNRISTEHAQKVIFVNRNKEFCEFHHELID